MLHALYAKLLKQARSESGDPAVGQLTVATVDREHPSYGVVIDGGAPVTLLGEGNMIGFSPVTLCRDTDGEEQWIAKSLIRNTDPRLTPISFGTPTPQSTR
jgi:hypothetical protein